VVTKRREKTRQIEATEMYIRKEGMVVVEMTAYDTKSGGVLGKSTTRKTFAEDYPQSYYPSSVYFPDTYSSRIPSDDEILNALMHKALGNMVKAFSPHFLPRSRKLDKGASGEEAVRSGIRKAQGGDWNGALSVWSEFLKKNPGSYAAHKNIAIAYEVTQRYSEALTHYRQALALRPKANDVRSAISEVERVFVPPPPSPPKLFHIVEKRDDGALYIDAGARDGAAVDDIFELLEEKEIRSTQGEVIGKDHIVVGTLRVAKVFERMSLAVLAAADKPEAVKIGDFVRKK
jgi:tetratricopeptide (TPR) repeat protein